MKNLAFGALMIGLLVACGGDGEKNGKIVFPDANEVTQCDPLMQTGCGANEKCTWIVDAYQPPAGSSPQYVGHIGCAPNGEKKVDEDCSFGAAGATGYDDCEKGLVCSNFRNNTNPGFCKAVCDRQGAAPNCDAQHACVNYSKLFVQGSNPAAAGVCDALCDPLRDNDFDGMGETLSSVSNTKRDQACRSDANFGCYGGPSGGTPPATQWSCTRDVNYNTTGPANLVHRTQCIDSNKCSEDAGATIYTNSCNQGYLPLLAEATGVTTVICVAMCKPDNCYLGNCGTSNVNRLGVGGDSCRVADRLGSFDNSTATAGHGEHCLYGWRFEIDTATGKYLPSPSSDTVGYCYDHDKYLYDDDGQANTPPVSRPPCSTLENGLGDATTVRAGDLGCVSTANVQLMTATGKVPPAALENMRKFELPRPPYQRVMNER